MGAKLDKSIATVFVVDDDKGLRESLKFLLSSAGWSVRAFADAKAFLDVLDTRQLGCVLVDLRMPGMSGLELQAELTRRGAKIPLLMMTAYAEVPSVVRAFKQGAIEFLEKPVQETELLDKVEQAVRRDLQARRHEAEAARTYDKVARLTPREREIMDMVVAGKATKVIAMDLGLSPKTVEVHRSRVMSKMEVTTIAALVNEVVRTHEEGGAGRTGRPSTGNS